MTRVTEETAFFSGHEHRVVIRGDGRRFWLDPAFLFALEHAADRDLGEHLRGKFGSSEEEAREIQLFLREAGLTDGSSTSEADPDATAPSGNTGT